jgi:hypothetical protein
VCEKVLHYLFIYLFIYLFSFFSSSFSSSLFHFYFLVGGWADSNGELLEPSFVPPRKIQDDYNSRRPVSLYTPPSVASEDSFLSSQALQQQQQQHFQRSQQYPPQVTQQRHYSASSASKLTTFSSYFKIIKLKKK